jgi:hypothetical protein
MEIEGLWQSADYRRDSKLCRLGNSERKKGKRRGRRMQEGELKCEESRVEMENRETRHPHGSTKKTTVGRTRGPRNWNSWNKEKRRESQRGEGEKKVY